MKLEDMTKEEILEALDTLHGRDCVDPERLPSKRADVTDDASGQKFWEQCLKYRQPLIDFIYRSL